MENLKEREAILDLMEEMVGHTAEEGFKPVSRYSVVVAAENVNVTGFVSGEKKKVKAKAEAELKRLKAQDLGKKFDMQRGDSEMSNGDLMLWYIVSERI